jgi:glycosyltransferase involved in cell wall biosynthesis
MKCAVITPIGPGHVKLYEECRRSIETAVNHSAGPFDNISIIPVDDSYGSLGRSAARNRGITVAFSGKYDWIFFLDSDDLLFPDAFELAGKYLMDYDAVWGTIVEIKPGAHEAALRNPQVFIIDKMTDLLMFDPFYTLQMGHFIRTGTAMLNRFNESMNTGEDFDYYLRVWETNRCIKIPEPLFINRRGLHSTGAKSASGKEWSDAVEMIMGRYRKKYGILVDQQTVLAKMKDNVRKYSDYLKSKSSSGISS